MVGAAVGEVAVKEAGEAAGKVAGKEVGEAAGKVAEEVADLDLAAARMVTADLDWVVATAGWGLEAAAAMAGAAVGWAAKAVEMRQRNS